MSMLLIDDDVALTDTIKSVFADEGVQIDVATDWEGGFAAFLATAPTLVVADYHLPGSEHGLRLLLEIKRLRPSVRVVLMSGVVDSNELPSVVGHNAVDAVFSKGDSSETLARLREAVEADAEEEEDATDWVAFASGFDSSRRVDLSGVLALDESWKSGLEGDAP